MNRKEIAERIREILGTLSSRLGSARRRAEEYLEKRDFSPRDMRAAKIGGVALCALVLFSLYRAASPDGPGMRGELEILRAQMREVRTIGQEYRYSSDLLRRAGSLGEEKEALISVAERALLGNQIARDSFSIRGTNPSGNSEAVEGERVVVVQVNSVSLSGLINVLYAFQESDSILRVSDLVIKTRFDDPSLTDASFRLSTFSFGDSG